ELQERIQADNEKHFNHEPVKVPRHYSPFDTDEALNAFNEGILGVIHEGIIPFGFDVRDEEWVDEEYPTIGHIPGGRGRTKGYDIPLPVHIWKPRAVRWAQGLHVLNRLKDIIESSEGYNGTGI
ncbi:hypothetical protein BXZ70DRAFT_899244, partial [Cristinia sonorae]